MIDEERMSCLRRVDASGVLRQKRIKIYDCTDPSGSAELYQKACAETGVRLLSFAIASVYSLIE